MVKKYKEAKDLIKFERGKELILVNGGYYVPLYIKEGKEYVLNFVREITTNGIKEKLNKEESELLNLLKSHKIIVPIEEKEEVGGSCKAEYKEKGHISLYLLVSQGCNLRCIYCYASKSVYSKKVFMREEVAYRAVERSVRSLRMGGNLQIVFFGGEPLLNWDLIKKVIDYTENIIKKRYKKRRIHYHITTNLTILSNEIIKWIKKYNISLLVDIDGKEEEHNKQRPFRNGQGSFKIVLKNLLKLKEEGIDVSIRVTVTKLNEDKIIETALYLNRLGFTDCSFPTVNPLGPAGFKVSTDLYYSVEKYIKTLKTIYKMNICETDGLFPVNRYIDSIINYEKEFTGCGMPYGNTPAVAANGDVYFCDYLFGMEEYKLGNVMEKGIKYKNFYRLNDLLKEIDVEYRDKCKECKYRYICGGGCPANYLYLKEGLKLSPEEREFVENAKCKEIKAMIEYLTWEIVEHIKPVEREKLMRNKIEVSNYC